LGRTLKEHGLEALIGLLVVLAAIGFMGFAWDRTQAGRGAGQYVLSARFPSVAGVSPGTDVRLAGIKVGQVMAARLDPASYQAVLELGIRQDLKLPVDSSAAISSEGLLGGTYIALTPGAEDEMLPAGGEILETSGAADLMALIGSVVNRSGEAGGTGDGKD
jgi:phospholipid/cholesterol/gamma-HCH transport system substrate-binding protein